MDFKVAIKCEKCKCRFELRPMEFLGRECLTCPNCGKKLDDRIFSHLKTGMIELSKVPDTVPEDAEPLPFSGGPEPEFTLKLQEYGTN